MVQQAPLRWRSHRLRTVPPDAARKMVRDLAPVRVLARSVAAAAPEDVSVDVAGHVAGDVLDKVAGVGAVDEDSIELPDLPESPQAKAATLLRVAAQIEHALMVQYLYAGASLTKPAQAGKVTGVAVEEMSHLMTVQNLLRLIGEPPHLHRQDDGVAVGEDERLFPFDFRLEPVSNVSLAKYVVAESPADVPAGVDPAVLAHILELATGSQQEPVNRVGTLYALLSAVFATPELLHDLATPADGADEDRTRWYAMVEQVAAEAALAYGGAGNVHLPDGAFDPAATPGQGTDADWDRAKTTVVGVRVHEVTTRLEALEALRDIGLQGEGPTTSVANETPHFRRFYDQFLALFGADGLATVPPPGAVRPLAAGARIAVDPGGADRDDAITDPVTARWAELADLRYALLLGALERFLLEPVTDRSYLRGWVFAEMHALRTLAALLGGMRAGSAASGTVAALPFTPPGTGTGSWSDLAAAFAASRTIAADLLTQVPADPDDPENGHRLLVHLLAADERKQAESQARVAGTTARTRTDEVRDALDWAAGAGNPTAGHSDHGRFWNLPHAELTALAFGDDVITAPPAPGEDATIVAQLRSGNMPRSRPALDPQTSPEFAIVEQWVADGRPDDALAPPALAPPAHDLLED